MSIWTRSAAGVVRNSRSGGLRVHRDWTIEHASRLLFSFVRGFMAGLDLKTGGAPRPWGEPGHPTVAMSTSVIARDTAR
jgi:hypothetical protein